MMRHCCCPHLCSLARSSPSRKRLWRGDRFHTTMHANAASDGSHGLLGPLASGGAWPPVTHTLAGPLLLQEFSTRVTSVRASSWASSLAEPRPLRRRTAGRGRRRRTQHQHCLRGGGGMHRLSRSSIDRSSGIAFLDPSRSFPSVDWMHRSAARPRAGSLGFGKARRGRASSRIIL